MYAVDSSPCDKVEASTAYMLNLQSWSLINGGAYIFFSPKTKQKVSGTVEIQNFSFYSSDFLYTSLELFFEKSHWLHTYMN